MPFFAISSNAPLLSILSLTVIFPPFIDVRTFPSTVPSYVYSFGVISSTVPSETIFPSVLLICPAFTTVFVSPSMIPFTLPTSSDFTETPEFNDDILPPSLLSFVDSIFTSSIPVISPSLLSRSFDFASIFPLPLTFPRILSILSDLISISSSLRMLPSRLLTSPETTSTFPLPRMLPLRLSILPESILTAPLPATLPSLVSRFADFIIMFPALRMFPMMLSILSDLITVPLPLDMSPFLLSRLLESISILPLL